MPTRKSTEMNKVTDFLKEHFPGDSELGTVICAVSGGADSMCLLDMAAEASEELGMRVICAHFNHRLRGEESDRDESFVREYCRQHDIEFISGNADVSGYAEINGMGIEEAARKLRYDFLGRIADENGARFIMTAHNAEDNVETVLLNLIRGAGLRGACGIPPVRGNVIRPLLETSRSEIESYLSERGIPHVEDSTNAADDYSRNRLRHHVLPVLEELNPAYTENIARACRLMRDDDAYLESAAEAFISDSAGGRTLPAKELSELPQPLFSRVVRRMCISSLSAEHIKMLHRLCTSNDVHAEADIPGQRVRREYDRVLFELDDSGNIESAAVVPGKTIELKRAGFRIKCSNPFCVEEIHSSLNTFFFKYENICGNIFVKSRSEGDRIRLSGRNCTKSLKKLFSEAKLPLSDREKTPVLYDDDGVIAVYGFGTAERCAASPGDTVICIEIERIAEANIHVDR